MAISHCCISHKLTQKKVQMAFYSFTLKVHEISIFYISLSTLLEWIYFDAASLQRWISFGLCMLFNFYFLCYELYIYYDMINYPAAAIGNEKYEYYSLKYGSLLKNIRFQEYDVSFCYYSATGTMDTQALVPPIQLPHSLLLQEIPHDDHSASFLFNQKRANRNVDGDPILGNNQIFGCLAIQVECSQLYPFDTLVLFIGILHNNNHPVF